MNRVRIILLLLVVLCVALAYAWFATPKQHRVIKGQGFSRQTDQSRQKGLPASLSGVAALDFSGGGDSKYQTPQKNLFGPLYLPPKPVKRRPIPPPPKIITKHVKTPQVMVPVVSQQRGPAPIQPLSVLGYLNKAGEYTVFLGSRKGDLFLVKQGDSFAEDLVVRSISAREITIVRRKTDQLVVLPLGEGQSQRMPTVSLSSGRPSITPQELNADSSAPLPSSEQLRAPDEKKPVPSSKQPHAPRAFINKRIKGLNNDAL